MDTAGLISKVLYMRLNETESTETSGGENKSEMEA